MAHLNALPARPRPSPAPRYPRVLALGALVVAATACGGEVTGSAEEKPPIVENTGGASPGGAGGVAGEAGGGGVAGVPHAGGSAGQGGTGGGDWAGGIGEEWGTGGVAGSAGHAGAAGQAGAAGSGQGT